MNKELEIFQDKDGNVYNIETELEHKLILCIVEQQEKLNKIKEYMNKNANEPVYLDMKLYEAEVYKDILELLEEIDV